MKQNSEKRDSQGERVWIYARKRAQTFVFGFGATLGLITLGFLTVAPEPLRFIVYIFGFAFAVFAITATFSWATKVTVIDKAKGYAGRQRRNCLGMERVETANLADIDRVVLFRQRKGDASGKRSYTCFELRLTGANRPFVVWGTSGSLSRSQIENGKELAAVLDLPFDDRSMPGDFPQKNAWLFEDEASQMGIDPCLAQVLRLGTRYQKEERIHAGSKIHPRIAEAMRESFAPDMESSEVPLLAIDKTFLGFGKKGVLITDKRVYGSETKCFAPSATDLKRLSAAHARQTHRGDLRIVFGKVALPRLKFSSDKTKILAGMLNMLGECARGKSPLADMKGRMKTAFEFSSHIVDERVFFHPFIPSERLEKSRRAYAGEVPSEERPLVLIDDSPLQNGSAGALITERRIVGNRFGGLKLGQGERRTESFPLDRLGRTGFRKGFLGFEIVRKNRWRTDDENTFFLENIPAERLARMRRDFPSMPKDATVLIMIDSSLSGKGKEGVIVTTQFVYVGKWGAPPRIFALSDLPPLETRGGFPSRKLISKKTMVCDLVYRENNMAGLIEILNRLSETAEPPEQIENSGLKSSVRNIVAEFAGRMRHERAFFFQTIPGALLNQAKKRFAQDLRYDEAPLALLADGIKGDARSGILVTDRHVYSKKTGPRGMRLALLENATADNSVWAGCSGLMAEGQLAFKPVLVPGELVVLLAELIRRLAQRA